jgi:hypothetical protein
MDCLGELGKEIIRRIMRCASLRHFTVRMWLASMNDVGELDGIVHEKRSNHIAHYK